jgi:Domain of unknown function (DUF4908)
MCEEGDIGFENVPTSGTARQRACPHRGDDVKPAIPGRLSAAIALAVLALVTAIDACSAESAPPLRIGHYSSPDGLIGFVLDRLGTPIKVRFDGSEEILALTTEPAPYDSTTFKRDDGIHVLRIYPNGRVLVFDEKLKGGSARAIRDQDAQPLTVKAATETQAQAAAFALGHTLKQTGGVTLAVALEARSLGDKSDGWAAMADAVLVTGVSFGEMLASTIARETIAAKLQRIVIRDAGRVDIKLEDRTLVVEIAADQPIVGRPSSARLKSAIGDLL